MLFRVDGFDGRGDLLIANRSYLFNHCTTIVPQFDECMIAIPAIFDIPVCTSVVFEMNNVDCEITSVC